MMTQKMEMRFISPLTGREMSPFRGRVDRKLEASFTHNQNALKSSIIQHKTQDHTLVRHRLLVAPRTLTRAHGGGVVLE